MEVKAVRQSEVCNPRLRGPAILGLDRLQSLSYTYGCIMDTAQVLGHAYRPRVIEAALQRACPGSFSCFEGTP